MFLTTYVNAVDPLARAYDGFLVHSRFGPAAPLGEGSVFDELQSSSTEAVKFRADLRVPLLTVITETDLFGTCPAGLPARETTRQRPVPDSGRFPAPRTPTTTRSRWRRSTPALRRSRTLSRPTRRPTSLMGQELGHYINFGRNTTTSSKPRSPR